MSKQSVAVIIGVAEDDYGKAQLGPMHLFGHDEGAGVLYGFNRSRFP